jgi:hypothetical protein
MKLSPFITAHPPSSETVAASQELIEAFDGRLPASLLELWRRHGLGRYGAQQLCLIDPRIWQATLDRWIVSPPDTAQRMPIALTPFGSIIYYRRLTATDEDVAVINPHTRSTDVLAWSLETVFNETLCDAGQLGDLIPQGWLKSAEDTHGRLADDECYEPDATLLAMEMLVIKCVEALDMHQRLRDAVDAPKQSREVKAAPLPLSEALPPAWRSVFQPTNQIHDASASALTGLYLSSDVGRHRLLSLTAENTYHLLFFSSDPNPRYQFAPRYYSGTYALEVSSDGETTATLDIPLRDDALGSDANDEQLTVLDLAGTRVLLRTDSLDDIAAAIHWNSRIRDPQNWFVQTTLTDMLPNESQNHMPAPPLLALPPSLRALIPQEPHTATIMSIELPEDDDNVRAHINLGRDHGLLTDMPFCSPAGSQKSLMGWVSGLEADRCVIRLSHDSDAPDVGDMLVSRDPDAGPIA